jgi:hypothetical protein
MLRFIDVQFHADASTGNIILWRCLAFAVVHMADGMTRCLLLLLEHSDTSNGRHGTKSVETSDLDLTFIELMFVLVFFVFYETTNLNLVVLCKD